MAVTTGFKQQCPSCEAQVPIKDPKLVGKKIDCPKCKYRFVVEDPGLEDEDEPVEEEAPAKGKKDGGKKSAKAGKAAKPAKGAKGAKRRGDDDDEDGDEAPSKKKGGASTTLIVGLGLAGVAIVLLGVTLFFVFSGGSSKPSGGSGGGGGGGASRPSTPSGTQPAADAGANAEAPKGDAAKPAEGGGTAEVNVAELTNLLPNESQAVLHINLPRTLESSLGRAVFNNEGGFSRAAIKDKLGISLDDSARLLSAQNFTDRWSFHVVRATKRIDVDAVKRAFGITDKSKAAKSPINGFEFFLAGQNDILGMLSKYQTGATCVHFMDDYTLVVASAEPMEKFLQDKRQPKKQEPPPAPAGQGGGPGGMQPGGPGGPGVMQPPGGGGPAGMQPPGGRGGPETPMPPGGRGGPASQGQSSDGRSGGAIRVHQGAAGTILPPGGMQPPGGGGGGPGVMQPPGGGGPGVMQPPGGMGGMMQPGGQGGEETAAPANYLTINPSLKALLDRVEESKDPYLISIAAPAGLIASMLPNAGGLEIPGLKMATEATGEKLAACIRALSPSRVHLSVAIEGPSAEQVAQAEQSLSQLMPLAAQALSGFLQVRIDVDQGQSGAGMGMAMGGQPGGPGMMPGGPGMGPGGPGMMPGGPGMGPRGPGGPGMMPGGPGMGPGGPGMQPGGPGLQPGQPGQQPGDPNNPQPPPGEGIPGLGGSSSGGPSNKIRLEKANRILQLTLDAGWSNRAHDLVMDQLRQGVVVAKGHLDMTGGASGVHELAEVLKKHAATTGGFPRGTVDRKLPSERQNHPYRPDQRLSWVYFLLPDLGFGGLQNKLDPQKSWEDADNLVKGSTLLPPLLDAKYPNATWRIHLPGNLVWEPAATHFVGMAGVGLDAAEFGSSVGAAGVFGYDRATKLTDIKDGPENTIAVIQVPPEHQTAWLAGGGSTVRGTPETGSVKPFVCREHKGKKGTYAIMANGDVRFIQETIPDALFKALCTIAGGEKVDRAELDKFTEVIPSPRATLRPQAPTGAARATPAPAKTAPAPTKAPEPAPAKAAEPAKQ